MFKKWNKNIKSSAHAKGDKKIDEKVFVYDESHFSVYYSYTKLKSRCT
jgi:hypothetical protein